MVKEEEFIFENNIYKISIGQNAQDNWNLIDNSSPNEFWFHTSNYPSSHVVVSNTNSINISKLPKQVITRCACICKANSKAKSLKKIEIIYTEVSNLTKTEIVGQVISSNVKSIII
jgi:predicted ribosome quality control (RQC) complex YloA/Tae2 family protein